MMPEEIIAARDRMINEQRRRIEALQQRVAELEQRLAEHDCIWFDYIRENCGRKTADEAWVDLGCSADGE